MSHAKVKYTVKHKSGHSGTTQRDIQVSSSSPTESEIISKLKSLHSSDIQRGADIILNQIIKTWD
tara:strand:+ start:301 stop:495 length:195 start_codon:yes stop_codon:yes gene_type:complete